MLPLVRGGAGHEAVRLNGCPCVLCNNGHPSQSGRSWFNGAQTGDTVQCSGPFPFDSHSTGGGVTPMRRLLSPGGSERCSFSVQEQRSEETPASPRWVGLKKQTSTQDRTSHPPTLTYTLRTLGLYNPLSRKFLTQAITER